MEDLSENRFIGRLAMEDLNRCTGKLTYPRFYY